MRKIFAALAMAAMILCGTACGGGSKSSQQVDSIYAETINSPATDNTIEHLWAVLEDNGMLPADLTDQAIDVTMRSLENISHAVSMADGEDDLADAFNLTAEALTTSDALKTARLYRYLTTTLSPDKYAETLQRLQQNHDEILTAAANVQRKVRGQYAETLADAIDLFAHE